jgi:hypothetical protein
LLVDAPVALPVPVAEPLDLVVDAVTVVPGVDEEEPVVRAEELELLVELDDVELSWAKRVRTTEKKAIIKFE